MQASLARWAIVSCSLVGMLGCAAGPKPSWWPGRKPNYSTSSATPPQLPPPQYGQQQPQYDPNGFGATQNPAAAQQYAGNGYPQGAGYPQGGAAGYPQGGYPQDYAGAQAAAGQPGYDFNNPNVGASSYPESYPTNNPYAAAGQQADYQNAQQAQAYPGQTAGGYPAGTVNNQYVTGGAGAGAGGMQTADSRYAAGAGAAGGGYNTDSRYDPGSGQSAGQGTAWGAGGSGAAAGGTGGTPADPWNGASSSSTYPSSTGYPDAGAQQDPHYRPGGTGDYSTPTGATGTSNAWSQGGSGGAGAGYNAANSAYPSTAAGGGAYGATGPVDRYGQPISGAAR